jgi:Phosphodiester glycosidase
MALAVALGAACSSQPTAPAVTAGPCGGDSTPRPGLSVERLPGRDGCVTLVRIDPSRFRLRLLTALAEGGSRTAPEWAHDFGLTGLINASMFAPDQRSIGLLVAGARVNRDRDNERLGAFLAFDPISESDAPVVLTGRDCPGFDLANLRRRYRSIVQNYRLLDCDGRPVTWKDERRFSAAAVGLDPNGHAVFIHTRAPANMSELAALLAEHRLRAAMYVEGGPEASLYVDAGEPVVSEVGTGLLGTSSFFKIPNVLGFQPRED